MLFSQGFSERQIEGKHLLLFYEIDWAEASVPASQKRT
jgi:hypothetical protein